MTPHPQETGFHVLTPEEWALIGEERELAEMLISKAQRDCVECRGRKRPKAILRRPITVVPYSRRERDRLSQLVLEPTGRYVHSWPVFDPETEKFLETHEIDCPFRRCWDVIEHMIRMARLLATV